MSLFAAILSGSEESHNNLINDMHFVKIFLLKGLRAPANDHATDELQGVWDKVCPIL